MMHVPTQMIQPNQLVRGIVCGSGNALMHTESIFDMRSDAFCDLFSHSDDIESDYSAIPLPLSPQLSRK